MKPKIFVSSLISSMAPFRAAAKEAIEQLECEAIMAEDFGAKPTSPQIACLQGVRQAVAVVLLMGERYGETQSSGLSATHEEYRDAREKRPVFGFVHKVAQREPEQSAFIDEAGKWASGLFWQEFSTPEELRRLVTKQLHAWMVANATGPVDEQAMLQDALAALPEEQRGYSQFGRRLVISLAPGPKQAILRPSEIDGGQLADEITQAALFGPTKLFSTEKSNIVKVQGHVLVLTHDEGQGEVRLAPEGTINISLPLNLAGHGMVVIEEDVIVTLSKALRYATWLLDKVDPTQRLTHCALAAKITGGDGGTWRTQKEQEASPSSFQMFMGKPEAVHLRPAHRPRPALTQQAEQLVEDLVALLRREWKKGGF